MKDEDLEEIFDDEDDRFLHEEDYLINEISRERLNRELIEELNRVFHEEKESIKKEKFKDAYKAVEHAA
jgi:hypothetical protein